MPGDPVTTEGRRPSHEFLELLTRPGSWRRVRVFGTAVDARYIRRRADIISLSIYALATALVVPSAVTTSGLEQALIETLARLPDFLLPLAAAGYDLLLIWVLAITLAALIRGHWRLVLGVLTAAAVAAAGSSVVDRVITGGWPSFTELSSAYSSVLPGRLVAATAMLLVAERQLSRPFRTAGRRFLSLAVLAAFLLPAATPMRIVCGLLLASGAAALARWLVGTPTATVSANDLREGLADLGVEAAMDPTETVDNGRGGRFRAVTSDGDRLAVQVIGRDEWDSRLTADLWRMLWYRKSGLPVHLSSRLKVEHQAFLTLLAANRGARVTPVVTAGTSRTGDALIATRIEGTELGAVAAEQVTDAVLATLWQELADLHGAGVAHGNLGPDAILVSGGHACFARLEQIQPITHRDQIHGDRAQLLVTTALVVGTERAVDAAIAAIPAEDAAALVSFLQPAAMTTQLSTAADQVGLDLAAIRTATATAAGIEEPELQKLWRVTWGSIGRLVILAVVAYLLLSNLADIGYDTIITAIRDASLPLLIVALLFGQVPRVAQGASLQAAAPTPIPLGRLTALVFATCFINLAVPSTAARVATSIRFFERSGSTTGAAISAGALDGVAGFISQITLLGGCLLLGIGTLEFHGVADAAPETSSLLRLVAIVFGALAVVAVVVALVPRLREWALKTLHQLREALLILRSPSAVVRLLAMNVLAELLFSFTIWIVLQAFGQSVSFADVVIINEAVALFAGLVPVPGGIGVTEAALSAGFVAVGVDEGIAFSAALCYRLCTFYLPPIWGYFALRWLRKARFL